MPHDKLLFLSLLGSLLTPTARFVQPSPSQRLVALLPLSIEDRQTSLAGWCSSREPGRGASLDGGWHRRCCATGATDSANPANPGNLGHCAARQPRLPNPLARHRRTGRGGGVPPGVMAGGRHPKACIRIARPPGMFCPCIHDGGAVMRANAGHDRRRCKARAPLRA